MQSPLFTDETVACCWAFCTTYSQLPNIIVCRVFSGAGNHRPQNTRFYLKAYFCISLTLWWPIFLYVERTAPGGQSKIESLNKTCKGKMKIEATEML